ncbi:MAG: hypothetical protein ACRD35_02135 [Candidatus Acidiferrales bacterium]
MGSPILAIFVILLWPQGLGSSSAVSCARLRPQAETVSIQGFAVRIGPALNKKRTNREGRWCRAEVRDSKGHTIFGAETAAMEIHRATGKDINGDGNPDLVIEGYTGGAHCCWIYWIVSLGPQPGLLTTIYNERDASFIEDEYGAIQISTRHGAFDYFDGLPHSNTFFPLVVLRLEGNELRNISSQFWDSYQREIEEARRRLAPSDLARFRAGEGLGSKDYDFLETKRLVLTIVLSYLYGGRPEEAWKVLEEMWPSRDQERIRNLILETRRQGILRNTTGR